jgi:hypothetical protein
MFRKILVISISLFIFNSARSQLKSPDDFLGYKVGSRFTPHWKIVNYFQHVAANAGTTMKLQQYGETYEGRPLLLAFISSAANISNLENIRLNNLRLANLAKDKAAPVEDKAPAMVWLSYNVHGNETSSSEAAMLTLFALVDPSNSRTQTWLKNTLVIIDPCINPDGRDRYVNWFTSVSGKNPNPQLMAREHSEPWPGGRSNHYNFDLNRDWAWQTQVETQQRIKVYDKWMPHVHVDFHEQSFDNPYFFAPAAQPFHEVITPWQRDFQTAIGKNHAKYFDENGWLYFTKEYFDLFYPSYGDTWPVYNGAIGMTYEQGGHGRAGSAVINGDGDTLTLYDRAIHHYTTSLSTVEVSSINAAKLVKEFRKYFNDAVSGGTGEYKIYVIRNDVSNKERIKSLLQTLDRNGIQYGTGSGNGRGYNYANGKEESFSINTGDIIISAYQPKSAMAKVLLEPKSKMVDSATYDITAWSLPYVYGVDAYASRDRITITGSLLSNNTVSNATTSYGYVIPWSGIQTVKLVGQLLQKGILLRYAEQPFEANGRRFERGAIIVLKTANRSFGDNIFTEVKKLADASGIQLYPVNSGFVDKGFDFGSSRVRSFKAPRVVLLTGEGINPNAAGEIWYLFDQEIDYPVTLVNATNFNSISWNEVDVLIMPDGNYRFLSDKLSVEVLKDWIYKGGRLVALENAVTALSKAEIGLKVKKAEEGDKKEEKVDYDLLKKFEDREKDYIPGFNPGSIFKVELDNTHPLAFGYPNYYYTLKRDAVIFDFIKDGGWNVGVIRKENQVAGFVGARLKDRLKDGLLFAVQQVGSGTITSLVDDVLFRSFWENGKLMFCNSVFLVGL